LAVSERRAVCGRRRDQGAGADLDAAPLEHPLRVAAQLVREGRQQSVGALDDHDPHLLDGELAVLPSRDPTALPERPRALHSRPAGPPPATTNVSDGGRASASGSCAARSRHARTWLRSRCACSIVFIPSVDSASAGLPKKSLTLPVASTRWSYGSSRPRAVTT